MCAYSNTPAFFCFFPAAADGDYGRAFFPWGGLDREEEEAEATRYEGGKVSQRKSPSDSTNCRDVFWRRIDCCAWPE